MHTGRIWNKGIVVLCNSCLAAGTIVYPQEELDDKIQSITATEMFHYACYLVGHTGMLLSAILLFSIMRTAAIQAGFSMALLIQITMLFLLFCADPFWWFMSLLLAQAYMYSECLALSKVPLTHPHRVLQIYQRCTRQCKAFTGKAQI